MTFRRDKQEFGELEDALRENAPTPPEALRERLAARMESNAPARRAAHPARRYSGRPVLAVAFAAVFLAVFAGFGGLGYATSVVSNAAHGTRITLSGVGGTTGSVGKGAKTSSNNSNNDSDIGGGGGWHPGPPHHQYPRFKLVCIITPHKEIPVILFAGLADFLINHGVAHLPPCNVNVKPT